MSCPHRRAPAAKMKTRLAGFHSQRGMALLIVLWVVALLSIIAGSYSYGIRSETSIVSNLKNNAQARSAAQAGVWLAIFQLQHPDPSQRWPANSSVQELSFYGVKLRIKIADEGGKLSLNHVNSNTLARLFVGIGLGTEPAIALADAILDWRDKDDLRRLNGAEAEDYRTAQLGYTPANRPFQSLSELNLVIGMERAVFSRIEQLLTLQGKSAQFDPARSGPQLREIMLGDGAANMANDSNYSYDKEDRDDPQQVDQSQPGIASPNTVVSTVTIHVEAAMPGGTRQQLSALVSLKPSGPKRRGSVLAWRENPGGVFDESGNDPLFKAQD